MAVVLGSIAVAVTVFAFVLDDDPPWAAILGGLLYGLLFGGLGRAQQRAFQRAIRLNSGPPGASEP